MSTTVTISKLSAPDALFQHFPNQHEAQECYLELDTRDGGLSCTYDPNIGGGTTFAHYHRLILTASIPCLTADAANSLMERVAPLAQTVVDGAWEEWDGNNNVGRMTDKAAEVWEQIGAMCAADNFEDSELVGGWQVYDWFSEGAASTISALEITADTTDEQLAEIARNESTVAETNGECGYNVLDADDVESYLKELREELREEPREAMRDELVEVVDELAGLVERRDNLVRRIYGWNTGEDALRPLAELAGVAHTTIKRIVDAGKTAAEEGAIDTPAGAEKSV